MERGFYQFTKHDPVVKIPHTVEVTQELIDAAKNMGPGEIVYMPAQPTWTTEKPTKPGWYWARQDCSGPHGGSYTAPEAIEVKKQHDGGLYIETYDEDEGGSGCVLKVFRIRDSAENCMFNEWAGPIFPPS